MTVHGNRYCLNHTDHIVILTGTQKEKKDKLEILSKSAMKDMDGTECIVILREKNIQEATQEWYMLQKEWA